MFISYACGGTALCEIEYTNGPFYCLEHEITFSFRKSAMATQSTTGISTIDH